MRRFSQGWPFDIFDVAAVLGLLLLGGSLWVIWPPAAGLAVGAILIVWSVVSALPPRREP